MMTRETIYLYNSTVMSNFLFTSESVTEGHPDKTRDQVSDAILDSMIAQDRKLAQRSECLTTTGLMLVAGRLRQIAMWTFPKGSQTDNLRHRIHQSRIRARLCYDFAQY